MIGQDSLFFHCANCYSNPEGKIAGRERKGEKTSTFLKSSLAISALGIILGGGMLLAYRALLKDEELMGQHHPVSEKCSKSFDTVKQLFYARNQDQLLGEIFNQCPEYKKKAAFGMRSGDAKDKMFGELFTEAIKYHRHAESLDYVQQVGDIVLRDQLLKKLGEASFDLKEKAFDQMSRIKRERAYEGWIRSLIKEGKEHEGMEMLEKKLLDPQAKYHMQYEVFYQLQDFDRRAQIAEKLLNGQEKDRAYRIVTENYVSLNRCDDALTFAKKVNFDGADEFADLLDAHIYSSKIDQIRRAEGINRELEHAIYAQRERLELVAECYGKENAAVKEAKAGTAQLSMRHIFLNFKIGSEIGRWLSDKNKK